MSRATSDPHQTHHGYMVAVATPIVRTCSVLPSITSMPSLRTKEYSRTHQSGRFYKTQPPTTSHQ